jgi:hypothetical protein
MAAREKRKVNFLLTPEGRLALVWGNRVEFGCQGEFWRSCAAISIASRREWTRSFRSMWRTWL